MESVDKKKYSKMESVLQYINKKFVTVTEEDVKKTNPVLMHVITTIITSMKEVSPLFICLYENLFFGGSYYDGLKVGKPEEFDLDLKLSLPKLVGTKLIISNQPGFLNIQMADWDKFEKSGQYKEIYKYWSWCKKHRRGHKNCTSLDERLVLILPSNLKKYEKINGAKLSRREYDVARELSGLKDNEHYLLTDKFMRWMESTVNLALNKIGKVNGKTNIPYCGQNAEIVLTKSGPAITALINYGGMKFDVDLVGVFKMTGDMWPSSPYRAPPPECNGKKEFLIVAKAPKENFGKKERCWRLSFQEQERILLNGKDRIKPALRLIKKLRDNQNHKTISSYFLKTVFLNEIEAKKSNPNFWNSPLSFVLMHMLKVYSEALKNHNIPYYWNKKNNLIKSVDKITLDNIRGYIDRVIKGVDTKLENDQFIIATYLSTPAEREQIKTVDFSNSNKSTVDDIRSFTENFQSATPVAASVKSRSISLDCRTENDNSKSSNNFNNNSEIILMLSSIQNTVDLLKNGMKYALEKINVVETSVEELKQDNVYIKNSLDQLSRKNNEDIDENASQIESFLNIESTVSCSDNIVDEVDNNLHLIDFETTNTNTEEQTSNNIASNSLDLSNNVVFDMSNIASEIQKLAQTVQDLKADNQKFKNGLKSLFTSE